MNKVAIQQRFFAQCAKKPPASHDADGFITSNYLCSQSA